MREFEGKSYYHREKPPKIEKKGEEIKLFITNEEIAEANDLRSRKNSQENPLSQNDESQLKELTDKREKELDRLIPRFKFEVIAGFKGTRDEAGRQFETAQRYFKSIIEMKKSGTLQNFALQVEKLQNWNTDPKRIEKVPEIFLRRNKKKLGELIKEVDESSRNKFSGYYESWDDFLQKVESRVNSGEKISKEEMTRFEKVINKDRFGLMADLPDHAREVVIYYPKLAVKYITRLDEVYHNDTRGRSYLKDRISSRRDRIGIFESLMENYNKKTSHTPTS